jgi:hypothetical protein
MTIFFTETRERFMHAILEQVAAGRIMEAHLFTPIRQGGVESGVAVIAARLEAGDAGDPEAALRYRVYTARYRHTLKGPDRGRWEVGVVAEADAPLVTVESVVRGVQARASDDTPVERFTGEEILAALRIPQESGG